MKAKQDQSYTTFKAEIDTLVKEQESFLNDLWSLVCVCELLDKAEDVVFLLSRPNTE